MDDLDQKYSDRLFWVVQTVFGVILGSGLSQQKDLLLAPFGPGNHIAFFAMVIVYGTAVWSWIDFSYTSLRNPYQPHQTWERVRVISDLLIVILYAVLWFSVKDLIGNPAAPLTKLLGGFVAIFGLYLISGWLRIIQHGPKASRWRLIAVFLGLHIALLAAYNSLFERSPFKVAINAAALTCCLLLTWGFRHFRRRLSSNSKTIGVDVDGVLADQITPLLPIIRNKYGIDLAYSGVTQWDLPIGSTDIKTLIEEQHQDEDYVRSLPVHLHAQEVLKRLADKHRIVIITARNPASDAWTKAWLKANKIPFDEFVNTKEKHNTNKKFAVLIDDYLGNVSKFLKNAEGKVVLFDQPWNQAREELSDYFPNGRLFVAKDWVEIDRLLQDLLKQNK